MSSQNPMTNEELLSFELIVLNNAKKALKSVGFSSHHFRDYTIGRDLNKIISAF